MTRSTFREADLEGATFSHCGANVCSFIGANMKSMNVLSVNFSNSLFKQAKLQGASLELAFLKNVVGDGTYVKNVNMPLVPYAITYTATHLQIGCQHRPIEWWRNLSPVDSRTQFSGQDHLLWIDKGPELLDIVLHTDPAKPYTE